MNKIIKLMILVLIITGCNKTDYSTNSNPVTTVKNQITVSGTSFSPNSLNVHVGDTITFKWNSGSHTTTSTSVPTGAASWNTPLNSSSTSFQYIITKTGTYNFQCNFHYTMGMTGTLTAN